MNESAPTMSKVPVTVPPDILLRCRTVPLPRSSVLSQPLIVVRVRAVGITTRPKPLVHSASSSSSTGPRDASSSGIDPAVENQLAAPNTRVMPTRLPPDSVNPPVPCEPPSPPAAIGPLSRASIRTRPPSASDP